MAAFVIVLVTILVMPKEMTNFWSKFSNSIPPSGQLNIHPEDRQWFEQNGWTVHRQPGLTFETFVRDDRFGKDAEDKEFHLSLLPEPFVGNLHAADIFILLLNPGFSPSNYQTHENPQFRSTLIANLSQRNNSSAFPFFYLDPQFISTSGFKWWESRLRKVVLEICDAHGCGYYDALSLLSKRIALIQLAPYHSVNKQALEARRGSTPLWGSLPSMIQAQTFIKRLCETKPASLILTLRSHDHWKHSQINKNCICEEFLRGSRGINFNLKDGPGHAILRKLEIGTTKYLA